MPNGPVNDCPLKPNGNLQPEVDGRAVFMRGETICGRTGSFVADIYQGKFPVEGQDTGADSFKDSGRVWRYCGKSIGPLRCRWKRLGMDQ